MKKFRLGIEGAFPGLPDATYRKAKGVSQSMLKPLAISPAHFKVALDNPSKPTGPMTFGRIGHHLLFTPTAPQWWAVRPEKLDLRTPDGKAWKAENLGKEWIDYDTFDRINAAVMAMDCHLDFTSAFKSKKRELSIFKWFRHGKSKVLRKGRIDLVPSGVSLCDVKFVEDAREKAFVDACYDYKWYLQAAYYLDLYNETFPKDQKTQFVFFAVEKEPPFPTQTYVLDQTAITRGRTEYSDLLKLYMECKRDGAWPVYGQLQGSAYSACPKVVGLPKWANKGNSTKGDFIFQ